jgi:hypothetical protein
VVTVVKAALDGWREGVQLLPEIEVGTVVLELLVGLSEPYVAGVPVCVGDDPVDGVFLFVEADGIDSCAHERRGLDEGSAALSSWDPERVRAPIAPTDFIESRRLRREGVDMQSEMRRRVAWELSCGFKRGKSVACFASQSSKGDWRWDWVGELGMQSDGRRNRSASRAVRE